MMPETKTIAKIIKAELGFEDHNIFGFNIDFKLDGIMHQGTGWYFLSNEHGGPLLESIMKAVGVQRWDQLVGKNVFVLHDEPRGRITGIEKLPVESVGGRFVFKEFYESRGVLV